MEAILLSAFVLGLAGTAHCLGMCGPIALALPLDRSSKMNMLIGVLQYNFGRILVYAAFGALIGSIGMSFQLLGILQLLSVLSGIVIIVYAWQKYGLKKQASFNFTPKFVQTFLSKSMGKLLASTNPFKLLLLGGLNGLLPCGMVYTALVGSMIMGHPVQGATYMILFGLGTLPGLVLVAFSAQFVRSEFKLKLQKVVPYFLTIIGLLLILRGMNLDIPYLSPKLNLNPTTGQLETNCHQDATACPSPMQH